MEGRREFTRQLLQKISGASPMLHQPRSGAIFSAVGETRPRVLVVADAASPWGLPVVREAIALRRFDLAVTVMADAAAAPALQRHAGYMLIQESPPDDGALHGVCAVVAATGPGWLSSVALGLEAGLTPTLTLRALWKDIPVYADISAALKGADGVACANPALLSLYQGYVRQLQAMGIHDTPRGGILPALAKLPGLRHTAEQFAEQEATQPDASDGRRVFITRRDVERYTGAQWSIPCNAVLTDAAKETAARRNIKIDRQARPSHSQVPR